MPPGYLAETSCAPSATCSLCMAKCRRLSETEVKNGKTTRRLAHFKDGRVVPCEDQVLVHLTWDGKLRR